MLCTCAQNTLHHALGLQFGSTVVSEPLIETQSLPLNSVMAYLFASLLPGSSQQYRGQWY